MARHVNYKGKKRIINLREMKLDQLSGPQREDLFSVSDHARLKPTYSVTEISWDAEILRGASLSIKLSWERTTKPLIRLCGCVGWSSPLMFACSYVRFSLDMLHKLRPSDYEINQAGVIIIFQCFHTLARSVY